MGQFSTDHVGHFYFVANKPRDKIIRRLKRDVFPWIGSEPVCEVTAPTLLTTMRRIEHRGAIETAHRALQNCGQVFRYAVATGRAGPILPEIFAGPCQRWPPGTTPRSPMPRRSDSIKANGYLL
jgi:hypothetical protein